MLLLPSGLASFPGATALTVARRPVSSSRQRLSLSRPSSGEVCGQMGESFGLGLSLSLSPELSDPQRKSQGGPSLAGTGSLAHS